MVFANFEELIEHVKRAPNCRTVAVAGSNDSHTLEAVLRGVDEGIVNLLLAGDKEETLAILKALGRTVPEDTIYHDYRIRRRLPIDFFDQFLCKIDRVPTLRAVS